MLQELAGDGLRRWWWRWRWWRWWLWQLVGDEVAEGAFLAGVLSNWGGGGGLLLAEECAKNLRSDGWKLIDVENHRMDSW